MTARPSRAVTLALAWMLRTGSTASAAAAKYKVDPSSITRAMHRAGLPVLPRGRPFSKLTKEPTP